MIDDNRHVIQMTLDQEVWVDAAREGDEIDDATVATEVTSFERVGDAYILEGAVLFAGYLVRPGGQAAGGPDVEHFHHRLPFVLRVPVRAQPRGVLNVASRIPSWQLEVTGDGWMYVKAVLQVTGLSSSEGYHFECGAQQVGDVWFDAAPVDPRTAAPPAMDDMTLVRGGKEPRTGDLPGETSEPLKQVVEQLSEARAGHGPENSLSAYDRAFAGTHHAASAATEDTADGPASADSETLSNQTTDTPVRDVDTPAVVSDAKPTRTTADSAPASPHAEYSESAGRPEGERAADIPNPPNDEPVAEFEFAYQADEASEAEAEVRESFVASRTLPDERIKAAAGFVPEVRVQSQPEGVDAGPAPVAEDGEEGCAHRSGVSERLWSFVDFHAPERFYTLRFVVVMEEETLDSVAERVGCSKGELIRVNRLSGDSVRAGQTLLVPVLRSAGAR